MPHSLQF